MQPMMSDREVNLLKRQYEASRVILEFGCGGSTKIACETNADRIYCVESDSDWIEKCSEVPEIKLRLKDGSLTFFHAFLGETISYGRPANKDGLAQWPAYASGVWSMMQSRNPDVILIDGRFRMSCLLQSLIRSSSETRILMHDFWSRPAYREALRYADILHSESDLVVLLPKKNLPLRDLAVRSIEYLLDPD